MDCPICRDSKEPGWLCAEHRGSAWGHRGCEAEGAPCACNSGADVAWREVFARAAVANNYPAEDWQPLFLGVAERLGVRLPHEAPADTAERICGRGISPAEGVRLLVAELEDGYFIPEQRQ